MIGFAAPAAAENLRIATFNVELSGRGPGILARDIMREEDQVKAVVAVIAAASPDILLLNGFDYDYGLVALDALAERLTEAGANYPYRFARRPNSGMMTDVDLDGDGKLRGPGDAQGYGRFAGEGGMAILSRLPLDESRTVDYSAFLWRDLPGALINGADLSPEAASLQRLSSTAHWAVPVVLSGDRRLTLLAYHATPPVFDGPEDRNGRRNHDETAFWTVLLDGATPFRPPSPPFVILGDANLDPVDGDGRPEALFNLFEDPRLLETNPQSEGGPEAALTQGGPNETHGGDHAMDTADWPEDGPGNLRVDYVLPSSDLTLEGSGVWWPYPPDPVVEAASRHRLVWIDITVP